MMNAMQMPMNNTMPMMGMMMATMKCDMMADCMMMTLKPAAGMDMTMFKNSAEMMAMMMKCGMPMMMHCGNMSMMCMSEDGMAMMNMMAGMNMPMMMSCNGMPMMCCTC